MTTNPTIFASALKDGERYDDQVAGLTRGGASVEDVIVELTTDDVRNACDVLLTAYEATDGVDGRVSIEVPPALAFDTEGTHRGRPHAVAQGRPAEPAHQDPGDHRGPAGDHRRPSARASASTSR